MNPTQLEHLLTTLVKQHLLQSVMIWGAPGIGKSHTVAAVAQDTKIDLIDYLSKRVTAVAESKPV